MQTQDMIQLYILNPYLILTLGILALTILILIVKGDEIFKDKNKVGITKKPTKSSRQTHYVARFITEPTEKQHKAGLRKSQIRTVITYPYLSKTYPVYWVRTRKGLVGIEKSQFEILYKKPSVKTKP